MVGADLSCKADVAVVTSAAHLSTCQLSSADAVQQFCAFQLQKLSGNSMACRSCRSKHGCTWMPHIVNTCGKDHGCHFQIRQLLCKVVIGKKAPQRLGHIGCMDVVVIGIAVVCPLNILCTQQEQ